MTKPGDVDHYTRSTYKAMAAGYYDYQRILLSLLPLAMRLAGPRRSSLHALIRRNYGANYAIIGRDHASPGMNSLGEPFYQPYEAQALVEKFSEEVGISVLAFSGVVYMPVRIDEELSKLSAQITHSFSFRIAGAGRIPPSWQDVARMVHTPRRSLKFWKKPIHLATDRESASGLQD